MNVEIKEPCAGCRHLNCAMIKIVDGNVEASCGFEDICKWISEWESAEKSEDEPETCDGLEGVYEQSGKKEPAVTESEKQVSEPANKANPEPKKPKAKSEKHVKHEPPHKLVKKCQICGKEFEGGPNSKFCPECKAKEPKQSKKVTVVPPVSELNYSSKPETIKDCKHNDCEYRRFGGDKSSPTCDYLLMTGQPRGCDISKCDKYKSKYK